VPAALRGQPGRQDERARCRFSDASFVVESIPTTKEADVQYILLIYGDEAAGTERYERMSEDERNRMMGEWSGYTQQLQDAGVHVAGEALQPTMTAKTVAVKDGERLVTDGPFAETKEQLGGFYIVDVASEQEALDWAAKMPSHPYGRVEARPVMVFDTPA
jgi:hypothetical protein